MSTINSRLIDKYNYELKELSYLSDINSDYIVLINTNTDGTAGYWSTGKALLQLMSELNKEVQLANTKIYYILTLDNEVDKESTDSLNIIAKFNTLSNSLNTFFKNCDLIEKRISPKQKWYDRLFNDIETEQLWKDQENSDIEWTDPIPTHFMPLLRYNIKKCYNYIYKKIKHQETEEQPIYGIDGMYVLKEFV